jgi:hypothetical protein
MTFDSNVQVTINSDTVINGNLTVTNTVMANAVNATSSLIVDGSEMNNHVHEGSPTAPDGGVSNTGAPI